MTIVEICRGVCYGFHELSLALQRTTSSMNQHLLATIDENRRLSHREGRVVTMNWDHQQFCFTRAGLSQLARTLERGRTRLYVGSGDYCVVAVDGDLREVWIGNQCLALHPREYHALLNATLRTETRLHGFRQTPTEEESKPAVRVLSPPSMSFYWN